ncbi:3-oxoacyl-ACP reductase [Companilactobacillus ginsenosidimutans]|uniref:3-ketoacyl-ACP reductase n=1 Tax=Companilactobacillus ginsenosidimutans TaxID=1007676 RepID=A0A0H4QGX0_9LACO|nr:3-ketoacyl-ACP reductase [Companilactobacillus ginsenosidimutans]
MAEDFSGKIVVVTGAASGIGLEQVKLFLENNAVVIGIDKNAVPLINDNLVTIIGDVTGTLVFEKLTKLLENSFKKIDIVCNTAGVLDDYRPVMDTSIEQWNDTIQTDLTSQFLLIKATLPLMLKQKHGVFVNMASIAGLVAGGGGVAYTAAKHAVIGMTKQLDIDYAARGIRANCIAPGAIDTPMNAADFAGDGKMAKWVADQTPAKRWAKPEEVAELTLFLASSRADYIHGSVIPIDGGWTAK